MEELPQVISLIFGLIVIVSITWFAWAAKSRTFLVIVIVWTLLQSILGLSGLYQHTDSIPPRMIAFGVIPAMLFILITFLSRRGRAFIDGIKLEPLTYFHSIRIVVEIVLAMLYANGVVSVYMTYEGTNFDILSGLTAPVIAYLAFRHGRINRKLLLTWNILGFLLLLNVVVTAVFAFPSPFQKLAFDQPNIAILYFPFNLLPTVVVPLVFFGHFVAIRRTASKELSA